MSMPRNVAIYSGFDVLCHALESYTAKPYNKRSPLLSSPNVRRSNPVSDVWVREALQIVTNIFDNLSYPCVPMNLLIRQQKKEIV
uniref:Alcohol dehydrogenase iron-type/glycerol dehydrogenase GldA domain-containing protein n=1 Tax=Meloidogyne javanica TaxID=6303 RepID=A0A915N7U6_MELJA